jgi:hypothetical protein
MKNAFFKELSRLVTKKIISELKEQHTHLNRDVIDNLVALEIKQIAKHLLDSYMNTASVPNKR